MLLLLTQNKSTEQQAEKVKYASIPIFNMTIAIAITSLGPKFGVTRCDENDHDSENVLADAKISHEILLE